MAMAVRRDNLVAFSVSADHLLCRYNLQVPSLRQSYVQHNVNMQEENSLDVDRSTVHRTKHPGNGAIDIRDDGRIVAVGGWDGKYV